MLRFLGRGSRRPFAQILSNLGCHLFAHRPPSNSPRSWHLSADHRPFLWCAKRGAHTEGIYVHHTAGGPSRDSVSVILGLAHAVKSFRPGMGFFCPIDKTSHGDCTPKLMKEVFKIEDDLQAMCGVTRTRAYELTDMDKTDDLMEEIFKAYENYKVNHDFVLVEGTSLRKAGDDTALLNSKIASTLGLPVLMVTNARKAAGFREKHITRWDQLNWEREVVHSARVSDLVLKRNFVEVLGSIVYGLPSMKKGVEMLRNYFTELSIPFLGSIPEDFVLQSVKVQEIITALGAEVLHGTDSAINSSTEANRFVIATSHLSELLSQIKKFNDSSRRVVVITEADRADVVLGSVDLHQSKFFPGIAAVVLTGGKNSPPDLELLLKERESGGIPPILLSFEPTFETAASLADLEGQIFSDSERKIERAQVLFDSYINTDYLRETLLQERAVSLNPKIFRYNIFSRAKQLKQTIVLPEGEEPRTVHAAGILLREGLCNLILLGDRNKIEELAQEFQVDLSLAQITVPSQSKYLEKYAQFAFEARKHKGMTYEQAYKTVSQDETYFGTCMVAMGDADGMVSGAIHTTANTIRPAFQLIKTEPGVSIASSVFFMCLQGKVLAFGDCAINTDPTSEELAAIAIAAADTAAAFGIQPRVALLSYATGDSNVGPIIQKVVTATAIAKEKRPDLPVDGPLQYDAAVNPETAKIKLKGKESPVAGKANVLIFPDLNTGNNTYKAVQQSTGAVAMGPVIQGLKKPVNDLSRGCTVDDIVCTVAITAVQAAAQKQNLQQRQINMAAGA